MKLDHVWASEDEKKNMKTTKWEVHCLYGLLPIMFMVYGKQLYTTVSWVEVDAVRVAMQDGIVIKRIIKTDNGVETEITPWKGGGQWTWAK